MNIKRMSVYKKISDDCRTFNSESDFLKYYEKNRETIDEINTRALNLKFKINGYKIGRKGGKIILYPVNNVSTNQNSEESHSDITLRTENYDETLKQEVEELKTRVNILESMMNQFMQQYDALPINKSFYKTQTDQRSEPNQSTLVTPQKYNWSFK